MLWEWAMLKSKIRELQKDHTWINPEDEIGFNMALTILEQYMTLSEEDHQKLKDENFQLREKIHNMELKRKEGTWLVKNP